MKQNLFKSDKVFIGGYVFAIGGAVLVATSDTSADPIELQTIIGGSMFLSWGFIILVQSIRVTRKSGGFTNALRDQVYVLKSRKKEQFHDTKIVTDGILMASYCATGLSLSTLREGVRVNTNLRGGAIVQGANSFEHKVTFRNDLGKNVDTVETRLIRTNPDRLPLDEPDFTFNPISQQEFYQAVFNKGFTSPGIAYKAKRERYDDVLDRFNPVFFNLSDSSEVLFRQMITAMTNAGKGGCYYDKAAWENIGIERWKGHSGARYTVDRKKCKITTQSPTTIQLNMPAIKFQMGDGNYWIFPDAVVRGPRHIFQDDRLQIFPLQDLDIYIERNTYTTDSVPSGVTPIGHTWAYVNQNGGPDRRYNDNPVRYILDVCAIAIAKADQALFTFVVTSINEAEEFADAFASYVKLLR